LVFDEIFLIFLRSTFQKTALISYPIGNIQPSFYTGENLLTGICKNCLKFTIRSYNKVCIERCKFELNQTVNKLSELIITGVRCYPWFDGSSIDLIMQVEQICSNNRVIYEWDFEKQSISVMKLTIHNLIEYIVMVLQLNLGHRKV
jgi:hypothetical protein